MTPDFFYMENKAINSGAGLIMATATGLPIFKIFKFETPELMARFLDKYQLQGIAAIVPGYRIVLAYIGDLSDLKDTPVISGGKFNWNNNFLNEMISFYESEKIKGSESRNKRYRINP